MDAQGGLGGSVTNERGSVELDRVTKRFGTTVAVDRIDLEMRAGEFISLLGPSGCGKTTTLRMLAGFEQPDEGWIRITRRVRAGRPAAQARRQHGVPALRPLPAHDGRRERRVRPAPEAGGPRSTVAAQVAEALDMVKMTPLANRKPAAALGRPAAARRPGPGPGEPAVGAAARRAARRPRPQVARGDADRAEAAADARSASPSCS